MSPKESEGMSVSGEEVLVEDNEDVQVSNNSETALKSKKTSIDVTKALMLLGFNSWSAFEQGIWSIFCLSNFLYMQYKVIRMIYV